MSKKDVHALTGIWDADSLRCLLDLADADDIGGIADSDLPDIAVMVLQDLAPLLELRPEWVVRLLSAGLDQHNILHRLYTAELVSGAFADAPGLIWQLQIGEAGDQGLQARNSALRHYNFDLWRVRLRRVGAPQNITAQCCTGKPPGGFSMRPLGSPPG